MRTFALCRDTRYTLAWWRPTGEVELPERVALHLDECPHCLQLFSMQFIPIRLMRRAQRARGFAEAGALAAVAAVMLFPISWQPVKTLPEDGVSIQEDEPDSACLFVPEDSLCDLVDVDMEVSPV